MLTAMTDVFDEISTWMINAVQSCTSLFYNATDSSLTLLGILAVTGLAFSIVFLIIGVIQNFLHLRG